MSNSIKCAKCDSDRTQLPDDEACPACGGTAVVRHVFLQDFAMTTDTIAEIKIRPDQQPRWWERWERMLRALDRLREAYADADSDELRRRVDAFFLDCWSLMDWIVNDDQLTPRPTKAEIQRYARSQMPLRACEGYVTVAKHKIRERPGYMEARISSVKIRPGGRHVLITYESLTVKPTTRDALRLAERCVATWQQFLDARGLKPPPSD